MIIYSDFVVKFNFTFSIFTSFFQEGNLAGHLQITMDGSKTNRKTTAATKVDLNTILCNKLGHLILSKIVKYYATIQF